MIEKSSVELILDIVLQHITNEFVLESQCGFKNSRSTIDIFSARNVLEKCIEQDMDLYHVFVELTKAFVSIKRIAIWEILKNFGCPEKNMSEY